VTASSTTASSRPASPWLWTAFIASALTATGFFFIPAFVIRPFSYQAPRALWWAMAIRQRAPLASLICTLICVALCLALWRASSRWGKAGLIALMILVAFSAVMSRLNYFEWMFHPVDSPRFEAEAATKLDKGEMVMTLRFGSDARAYPIREMAYHHVLNDVVEGVPVVVTY
jgi:type IV secretory pathway VirB2 component (pilin)